jgi:hypothetical protein
MIAIPILADSHAAVAEESTLVERSSGMEKLLWKLSVSNLKPKFRRKEIRGSHCSCFNCHGLASALHIERSAEQQTIVSISSNGFAL